MDDLESKPTKELSDVETQKLEKEITDMQIKVLSADNDEYWKIYGELIANPQARKLMQLFARKEMILNDAVKIMDGDYSNLKRHVTKMLAVGHLQIIKKRSHKKTKKEYNFFKGSRAILFFPDDTQQYLKEKGILKKLLHTSAKVSLVSILAATVWFQTRITKNSQDVSFDYGQILDVPFYSESMFFPMLIIIVALVINSIYEKKKRDRSIKT